MFQQSVQQQHQVNPVRKSLSHLHADVLAPEIQRLGKVVVACRQTDRVVDAVRIMTDQNFSCLPVVNPQLGQVIGLLSLEDVSAYLAQRVLPQQPAGRGTSAFRTQANQPLSQQQAQPQQQPYQSGSQSFRKQESGQFQSGQIKSQSGHFPSPQQESPQSGQYQQQGQTKVPVSEMKLGSQGRREQTSPSGLQFHERSVGNVVFPSAYGTCTESERSSMTAREKEVAPVVIQPLPTSGQGGQDMQPSVQGQQPPPQKSMQQPQHEYQTQQQPEAPNVSPQFEDQSNKQSGMTEGQYEAPSTVDSNQSLLSCIPKDELVANVMDFSGLNPLELVLDSNSGAYEAVSILSKPNGPKRVIIVDSTRRVRAMVTRTDAVRWVSSYGEQPQYQKIMDLTLLESGIKPHSFKQVNKNMTIHQALGLIQSDILAVVDDSREARGRLIGSFSTADLKNLFGPGSVSLNSSLETYLMETTAYPLRPPTVKSRTTLRQVAREFSQSKDHLLWTVDDSGVPTGVITSTDFLNAVFYTKTSSSLCDYLSTICALDLVSPSQKSAERMIAIKSRSKLSDAVHILTTSRILAAPVITDKVVGMISLDDIALYLAHKFGATQSMRAEDKRVTKHRNLVSFLNEDANVDDVISFTGRSNVELVRDTDDAQYVMRMLCDGRHHRVIVIGPERRVRAIITQSDAIRYLHETWDRGQHSEVFQKKLSELGIVRKAINSVHQNDSLRTVLDAYRLGGHGSIALVDDMGCLTGNFSTSDFKLLFSAQDSSPHLEMSVGEYLQKYSPHSLKPEIASLDWTLLELTRNFVDTKLHHFWLVDEIGRPAGVITQTDFVQAVVNSSI